MSVEQPSASNIVQEWALSYGRRIPTGSEQRVAAYLELMKTFEEHGYGRSDITTSVYNEIVKVSVPEHYKPLAKKVIWTQMASQDLQDAISIKWPLVKIAKLTEEELAPRPQKEILSMKRSEEDLAAEAERKTKRSPVRVEPEDDDLPSKPRKLLVPNMDLKPAVEYDDDILKELGLINE